MIACVLLSCGSPPLRPGRLRPYCWLSRYREWISSRVMSFLSVSAFFPCYNDGGTIARVVILANKTLQDLVDDYEIIVVDDGSTDQKRRRSGGTFELQFCAFTPCAPSAESGLRGSAPDRLRRRPPKTGSSIRTAMHSTTWRSYGSCWRSSTMASMLCRDTSSSARIRGIGY